MSEQDNLKVSVVVPVYNAQATLRHLIDSLLAQDYPKNNLEIIMVDDGSTDNSAAIIKERAEIKYLYQKNAGPAAARNYGWQSATGEIVCFMDADCFASSDWLTQLLFGFRSKDIAAVAGTYGITGSQNVIAWCVYEEIQYRHKKMPDVIRAFGSYNVAIRMSVLKETGGFNSRYRQPSAEDYDLSYRIAQLSYKIYFAKGAFVYHFYAQSIHSYFAKQFRHGFWRMKLYRNHPFMLGKDDYANWRDVVDPLLALAILILFCLAQILVFRIEWKILLVVYTIMQVPLAVKITLRKRNLKYLNLFWLTFIRGFARGLGTLFGLLRFGVIK